MLSLCIIIRYQFNKRLRRAHSRTCHKSAINHPPPPVECELLFRSYSATGYTAYRVYPVYLSIYTYLPTDLPTYCLLTRLCTREAIFVFKEPGAKFRFSLSLSLSLPNSEYSCNRLPCKTGRVPT